LKEQIKTNLTTLTGWLIFINTIIWLKVHTRCQEQHKKGLWQKVNDKTLNPILIQKESLYHDQSGTALFYIIILALLWGKNFWVCAIFCVIGLFHQNLDRFLTALTCSYYVYPESMLHGLPSVESY
jgi:hypothetical protein